MERTPLGVTRSETSPTPTSPPLAELPPHLTLVRGETTLGQVPTATENADLRKLRVVVQQPALVRYRVPVFREFANRPGIDLKLVYAEYPGLPNVPPDGFVGEFIPLRRFFIRGQEIYWHNAQWRFATKKHSDVLILSWNSRYASLIPTLLRARLNGVKTVVWGHGVSKKESRLSFWLRSRLAKMANAVLFYNHTNAKVFTDQGFDPRRVFVALNSLDQSIIQAARQEWLDDPARLASWQREKGLDDKRVVLFVSRLDVNNRVGLLVDAAQRLVTWNTDVRVVIVGAGEDAANLKAQIAEKSLDGKVLMVGAVYEEKQLAPYFLSASVYCYPRNIGLSILHAFGYGLPVVTGDDYKSHNPEIEALRPDENGMLYKDGDAASLADTLRTILADPAVARRMGEAAHRTVMERFSVKVMVDGFEAAVRYCVGKA